MTKLPLAALLAAVLAAPFVQSYSFTSPKWGLPKAPLVPIKPRSAELVMKADDTSSTQRKAAAYSLGSIFGGKGGSSSATTAGLEPHPSVRDHISPLNRLAPNAAKVGDDDNALPVHPDVRSGVLENGLPYIILPNKSPPGRFEAHLQVFSGSGALVCGVKSVERECD